MIVDNKMEFTNKNIPLVTIVTAIFNGEKYLEETIESVLNQTYKNIEYIIIDGGSTDKTLDIIKKYESKIDYWVSEKDKGIYDAWNKAIKVSNGEWISFLGADDILNSNAIELYIAKILAEKKEIEYISSKVLLCTNDKKPLRTIGTAWNWNSFSKYMNVAHVGSLHNKSIYSKYGLYDINFKICADYELLLRANKDLKSSFIDVTTCNMRVGGISDSNLNVFKETYLAKIKNNARTNKLLTIFDMLIAIAKWNIRKIV